MPEKANANIIYAERAAQRPGFIAGALCEREWTVKFAAIHVLPGFSRAPISPLL
jgi:hypothetical protein